MKTAMQELIEILTKEIKNNPFINLDTNMFAPFIEKEKEQIIDAFEDGQTNVNEDGCLTIENGAEEYYKETYK